MTRRFGGMYRKPNPCCRWQGMREGICLQVSRKGVVRFDRWVLKEGLQTINLAEVEGKARQDKWYITYLPPQQLLIYEYSTEYIQYLQVVCRYRLLPSTSYLISTRNFLEPCQSPGKALEHMIQLPGSRRYTSSLVVRDSIRGLSAIP